MPTHKAVHVAAAGQPMTLVDVETTPPPRDHVRIADGLSFVEAAPLGCAGVTTFHALRGTKAVSADLVAVLGIGGLGHLGVQFACAMGFETVAIARGAAKADDARELGAHHYIDS